VRPVLIAGDGTQLWWELIRTAPTGEPAGRPVVVLCPPGGRNAAYWPPAFIEALTGAGLDVVRFDWRGQGRSGWTPGAPPAAVLVEDLDVVCRTAVGGVPREPTPPAGPAATRDVAGAGPQLFVVGAGLGGWVAARLARRWSDRGEPWSRLVLVGTSGWYADPAMAGPAETTVVSLVLRRRGGGPAELARALGREIAVEAAAAGPADGERGLDEARRWLAHGFNPEDGHRITWLAAPSLWADAAGLAAAVVVLHGERDPVVPVAHAERLAQVTGGELQVVPGVGHHVDETLRSRLLAVLDPTWAHTARPGHTP